MIDAPQTSTRRPLSRRPGPWATAALAVLLAVALILAGLYLNRRAAARHLLTGWLEQRGVDAEVDIERIELDGLVGRIRIGDPDDPDLTVERVEVDYAVAGPWAAGGAAVTPSRIRLLRPVLRARWSDGALSLGSLDPLIEEFTGRPPRPESPAPLVLVEDGRLRLQTEAGLYTAQADARVEDGRLARLSARAPAGNLRSGDLAAEAFGGTLEITTQGDVATVKADLAAGAVRGAGAEGRDLRLSVDGTVPYPDTQRRRGDGRADLRLALAAADLSGAAGRLNGVQADLTLAGETRGWIEDFRFDGQARGRITADRAATQGQSADRLALDLSGTRLAADRRTEGLGWRLEGPARLQAARLDLGGARFETLALATSALTLGGRGAAYEAEAPVEARAGRARIGDLDLRGVEGRADLDLIQDGPLRLETTGRLRAARGAWPLFGPARADDLPDLAEMKRALGDFAVDLPGFALRLGPGGTQFDLTAPARAAPANGGVLTVAAGRGPAYGAQPGQAGGGGFRLSATRGRGLPEIEAEVPEWRLTDAGFQARLDGRAGLDFGPARGIGVVTRGLLASGGGVLTYASDDCAAVTVARLELGEDALTEAAGSLCALNAPLVTVRDGRWDSRARFTDLKASAPFLELAFAGAEGRLTASGGPAGLALDARVDRARVTDAGETARFYPLRADGTLGLSDERWTGRFDLSTGAAGGVTLGRLDLVHDGRREAGGLDVSVPAVTFAEGGLQPDDLTPLTRDLIQSPAVGAVAFDGRFDWSAEGATSHGRLSIPRLDFASPAGPVTGLTGDIAFTSLAPLETAPFQVLRAERLETVSDVRDLALIFAIDPVALTVASADIEWAGGTARIEPLTVPFDWSRPFQGALVLERVQLGALVEGAGLSDKVQFDAVVSGRLPFVVDPENGLRVVGGAVHAVQPGRLSIRRETLSGLEAGGGGEIAPNVVQDLAYQAMENLAFDQLSADVNSQDNGRLGMLFRIKGRHDPPQRQELRLTWRELISRRFLDRALPLPSGVEVDLTLDTSVNARELVSDLLEAARARAGGDTP